ncbi:unnamed protein product, partial [Meganyctiphanes norvegica]
MLLKIDYRTGLTRNRRIFLLHIFKIPDEAKVLLVNRFCSLAPSSKRRLNIDGSEANGEGGGFWKNFCGTEKASNYNNAQGEHILTTFSFSKCRTKNDFVRDNIERLQEIQAKCKQHNAPSRREPLKATREAKVKVDPVVRKNKNEGQLVSVSRAGENRQRRGATKSNGFEGKGRMIGSGSTTHSDYYSLSDDHDDNIENTQASSPYGRSQMLQEGFQAFTTEGESRPGSGLLNPIKNTIMQNLRDAKNEEHFSRNSLKFNRNNAHQQQQQQQQEAPNSALAMLPRTTRAERRAHVSQVISKIKGQRPACEIDYNRYCRELENQHRLLLNPSETMSMYGTTVEGSIGGRTSQRQNGSIRARSCSTERDSVISQRDSSRRQQHPPKQYPASTQIQQPQIPRRFSRSTSNLSSIRSQMGKKPLDRPGTNMSVARNGTDRRRMSNQIEMEKNPLPSLSRSKSNLEPRRRANSISSNRNTKNYLDVDHTQETDRLSYASQDLDYYNENKMTKNKQGWGTPSQMHLGDLNVTDATENNENINGNLHLSCRHNEHNYNDNYENDVFGEENYENSGSTSGIDVDESGSIYYGNNVLDSSRFEGHQHETARTVRAAQNEYENSIAPSSRLTSNYKRPQDNLNNNIFDKTVPEKALGEVRSVRKGLIYDGWQKQDDLGDYSLGPLATMQQEARSDVQPNSSLRRSRSQQELHNLRRKNQEKKEKEQRELKQKQKKRHKLGSMPKYLLERKEEEARYEAAVAAIDPECPDGHTVLEDAERRNTLHLLKKSQAEVMRDISSLPVANDTLRLKKHREELEEKLNQIEEGLAIFSQPKVYVLNDEDD